MTKGHHRLLPWLRLTKAPSYFLSFFNSSWSLAPHFELKEGAKNHTFLLDTAFEGEHLVPYDGTARVEVVQSLQSPTVMQEAFNRLYPSVFWKQKTEG